MYTVTEIRHPARYTDVLLPVFARMAQGRQRISGAMQWGEQYRQFHVAAWREVWRVLELGGVFVLNIKDHIRKGERVKVTDWHIGACESIGFALSDLEDIDCPGNRYGQNGNERIGHESVIKFVK